MSWLSKVFGGGSDSAGKKVEAIDYNGFRILPEPMSDGGQFRLAARIEAEEAGETKSHHLIRADMLRSREEAETAAVAKAKQMIDQMGMRLFD